MGLPTTDEFIASCKKLRQDGLRILEQAKASGASASEISKHESIIAKTEKMILLKGGTIDA